MVCARMLNILNLIDDTRCFETVRAMRWPQGVTCPHCDSPQVTKQRKPKVTLSGEVECDEVYGVAGHKGKPEEVKKRGGPGAAVG